MEKAIGIEGFIVTPEKRKELMVQKAELKRELLNLTKNLQRVREILSDIEKIDRQLGA